MLRTNLKKLTDLGTPGNLGTSTVKLNYLHRFSNTFLLHGYHSLKRELNRVLLTIFAAKTPSKVVSQNN